MKLTTFILAAVSSTALFNTAAFAGGLATPEEAVTAYLEGVADHSLKQIIAATSVNEMAEGFDFVDTVDRLGALTTGAQAPTSDPMFIAINKATYTAQIARQALFLTYGLLTTSEIAQGNVAEMDGVGASAFAEQLDLERLAGLVIEEIGSPLPTVMGRDAYKQTTARMAQGLGAQELTERVALVSLDNKTYRVGFTLVRYTDGWGVQTQASPLAGDNLLGGPTPFSPDEFANLTR